MTHSSIPIACSLTTAEAARQTIEWTDLHRHAVATERLDGGAAMTFPIELAGRVEDLAEREANCCGFLSIRTSRTGETVRLEITSENPEAIPMIEAMTGTSGR